LATLNCQFPESCGPGCGISGAGFEQPQNINIPAMNKIKKRRPPLRPLWFIWDLLLLGLSMVIQS
jgi:hypothetical protein